eukprot:CAMPEP_0196657392 /NCGR_PEP_ID=MMETSP1086-20130531/23058_1 /TAXON_ID=77921 /ORGANISM="Cyanoptyche  gloeocystis , Strain SAG4.97" /LENGTH=70 /DNA_ID=CAMNT_0041990487 /DNA_START=120 /DNA_END=332 /DNA_ORIENTATION=+
MSLLKLGEKLKIHSVNTNVSPIEIEMSEMSPGSDPMASPAKSPESQRAPTRGFLGRIWPGKDSRGQVGSV